MRRWRANERLGMAFSSDSLAISLPSGPWLAVSSDIISRSGTTITFSSSWTPLVSSRPYSTDGNSETETYGHDANIWQRPLNLRSRPQVFAQPYPNWLHLNASTEETQQILLALVGVARGRRLQLQHVCQLPRWSSANVTLPK